LILLFICISITNATFRIESSVCDLTTVNYVNLIPENCTPNLSNCSKLLCIDTLGNLPFSAMVTYRYKEVECDGQAPMRIYASRLDSCISSTSTNVSQLKTCNTTHVIMDTWTDNANCLGEPSKTFVLLRNECLQGHNKHECV